MIFSNKLLFYLGIGNHKFNSHIWKEKIRKRRLFIKDILESQIAIGMTQDQVIKNFGFDMREYTNGVWSYVFSTFKNGEIREMLCFYFDENDKVKEVKTKFRRRLH
jgi:outer membrane protein assembly factor BamE (lipoprotein component of BamABCDE complex)